MATSGFAQGARRLHSVQSTPTVWRNEMREVAELNGDGIAGELREAIHAINEALGSPVSFRPIDWSLERREASATA